MVRLFTAHNTSPNVARNPKFLPILFRSFSMSFILNIISFERLWRHAAYPYK